MSIRLLPPVTVEAHLPLLMLSSMLPLASLQVGPTGPVPAIRDVADEYVGSSGPPLTLARGALATACFLLGG